ncbi:MAG: nucleotidyltransferase [Armatimonadetes bacterium]|nr:nucleotidyltransferase [Armatimonadota bacterium]
MRRLHETIEVRSNTRGEPIAFTTRGGVHRVEHVVDHWFESGRWWDGEPRKAFWRVDAGGLFDLSCDEQRQWRLELAWD